MFFTDFPVEYSVETTGVAELDTDLKLSIIPPSLGDFMKYLFLAISALTLTACQQGPLVKSEPFDWRKAVAKNAERTCRDKMGTALYTKCVNREVVRGEGEARRLAAQFNVKLQ